MLVLTDAQCNQCCMSFQWLMRSSLSAAKSHDVCLLVYAHQLTTSFSSALLSSFLVVSLTESCNPVIVRRSWLRGLQIWGAPAVPYLHPALPLTPMSRLSRSPVLLVLCVAKTTTSISQARSKTASCMFAFIWSMKGMIRNNSAPGERKPLTSLTILMAIRLRPLQRRLEMSSVSAQQTGTFVQPP